MFDRVLTDTAGPVAGFGPVRLTALPATLKDLPRIDAVLTSHDHYDDLDLPTESRANSIVRHVTIWCRLWDLRQGCSPMAAG